jgi:hypothetical protein
VVPVHLEVVTAAALGYAARPEIIGLRQPAYGEELTRLFDEPPVQYTFSRVMNEACS